MVPKVTGGRIEYQGAVACIARGQTTSRSRDGAGALKHPTSRGIELRLTTGKWLVWNWNGFLRHTDQETGVPAWWPPFEEQFTFTYPQR